jgi:phenylacetate-CoA ligase
VPLEIRDQRGAECECSEARAGLQCWEDHFLFEVVDPKTLEPLPIGEAGELVITTLTKEALPLIRYRTRDITRLNDEPCVCGRTHVRIMRVTGRTDDMLIVRGVNVYPSQIEAALIGVSGLTPHYQLVLTRSGALDELTIEVELAPDGRAGEAERRAQAAAVRTHVKSVIGVTCAVAIKAPGEVPRSEGKAVRVKDLRAAEAELRRSFGCARFRGSNRRAGDSRIRDCQRSDRADGNETVGASVS